MLLCRIVSLVGNYVDYSNPAFCIQVFTCNVATSLENKKSIIRKPRVNQNSVVLLHSYIIQYVLYIRDCVA